ncbi:MAG TPA: hypothetical protein PKJ85_09535 [Nitrosomonas nitrosa]|nr:MAG: hypothetical protein NMNS02_24480 [Nitrosomonas sp.]HNP52022.1 hypothetical protein [Nitrosomonas nitrosa]
MKSNALIALVLKQDACLENWYIFEYILSHPIHNAIIEIFGVQPSGVNAHFGQIEMANQNATVNLHALNTSYVQPLELDAK